MSTLNQAYRQYAFLLISSLILTIVGTMMGDWFVGYWKMPLLPFIISLLLLIAIRFMKNPMKTWMFFLFSFLEGISLTPIVYYYLATDNQVLVSAITVTTLLVGICLVLGHRAKNLGLRAGNLGYSIAEMKASGFSFIFKFKPYVFYFFK